MKVLVQPLRTTDTSETTTKDDPPVHFVNVSDLVGKDWRFLEPINTDHRLSWSIHYGRPSNILERRIKKPNIGRYRSALSAVREVNSREDAVLVSHLPRVSAVCNTLRHKICPTRPHIAFSFNFTDLPTGRDKRRLSRALQGIDAYIVFSSYEVELYSNIFGIPGEKIFHLPWAMDPPHLGSTNPVGGDGEYLCSIGGEGRDYALLADAMRQLPQKKMVVIARPHAIEGVPFPDNVKVLVNQPAPTTWRIAADSDGLIVPLRDADTACGHVTIVGGQLLGIPIAATQSVGIKDYINPGQNGLTFPAGDVGALVNCLKSLQEDKFTAKDIGQTAKAQAKQKNHPKVWLKFFDDFSHKNEPKK